eukprot:g5526.t1
MTGRDGGARSAREDEGGAPDLDGAGGAFLDLDGGGGAPDLDGAGGAFLDLDGAGGAPDRDGAGGAFLDLDGAGGAPDRDGAGGAFLDLDGGGGAPDLDGAGGAFLDLDGAGGAPDRDGAGGAFLDLEGGGGAPDRDGAGGAFLDLGGGPGACLAGGAFLPEAPRSLRAGALGGGFLPPLPGGGGAPPRDGGGGARLPLSGRGGLRGGGPGLPLFAACAPREATDPLAVMLVRRSLPPPPERLFPPSKEPRPLRTEAFSPCCPRPPKYKGSSCPKYSIRVSAFTRVANTMSTGRPARFNFCSTWSKGVLPSSLPLISSKISPGSIPLFAAWPLPGFCTTVYPVGDATSVRPSDPSS